MPSPKAFALQELTACWDQGYEALVRGDLDQLTALLEIADGHVSAASADGCYARASMRSLGGCFRVSV